MPGAGERVLDDRRADDPGGDAVLPETGQLGEPVAHRLARVVAHDVEDDGERVRGLRVRHHPPGGGHVLGEEGLADLLGDAGVGVAVGLLAQQGRGLR